MAYFSNSTDGAILDGQCDECIHEDPEAGCPVALVQMLFNYDQCGIGKLESCLNMLVNVDGICLMKPVIEKYYTKKPLKEAETSTHDTKYAAPDWVPKSEAANG